MWDCTMNLHEAMNEIGPSATPIQFATLLLLAIATVLLIGSLISSDAARHAKHKGSIVLAQEPDASQRMPGAID